jgi:glycosyltransferase A (GT-A) superfamily protein (DUF2064 family)
MSTNGARARRLATSFILEMRGTARSRRRAGPCVGGFRHGARAAAAILSIGVQTPGAAALPDIYPDPGKAKTDLAAALQTAAANHRRNIGRMDQNLDLAERYEIPLKKGVPALAVLDSDGRLLYSQRTGEFEAMRRMQSSAVTEFLTQWKPVAPAGNTRSGS